MSTGKRIKFLRKFRWDFQGNKKGTRSVSDLVPDERMVMKKERKVSYQSS